jgi:DNA modification methylase
VTSINSLLSDHKNARRRTDRSAELIKESLQRYGAARSIVIDEDNRILAGNGTIEGAKAAGIKNVRIIETDGTEVIAIKRTGLSEDEKVGLALADNRTADLSEWDQAMLHSLSQEHDLSPWFNQEDLNELLAVTELPPEEGKTDPDDVPEPPADPTTKPGDLWILGNHRLLCGDSTNIQHVERLMDGQKADMVFTDPPYGMKLDTDYSCSPTYEIHKGRDKSRSGGSDIYKNVAGDHDDFTPDLINTVFASFNYCDEIFLWGADYYAEHIPSRKEGSWVVWDKVTKADGEQSGVESFHGSNFELCWSKAKHKRELARIMHKGLASVENDKRVHPTQKPVALAEWFFERWGNGRTVVADLYGGSGTTLIACEKTHRHCRMMELDPAYVDAIVKRWEDFTGNTAVCHPSDAHFSQPDLEDF